MFKAINKMKVREDKGFTLVELLIVVAIIGILAAIAIPQFSAYRIRAFNAAAVADIRNVKTVQESVYAEYRGYGSTQTGTTLIALGQPALLGVILTGPLSGATGNAAGPALATMLDSDSNQILDSFVGFGIGVSNNVSLVAGVDSIDTAVGTGYVNYQMRSKHRDGNRGFATNGSPAICYSENDTVTYKGAIMTAAAIPSVLVSFTLPCTDVAQVSDGLPVARYVGL